MVRFVTSCGADMNFKRTQIVSISNSKIQDLNNIEPKSMMTISIMCFVSHLE